MQHALIIHEVEAYPAWKVVFDQATGIRKREGCAKSGAPLNFTLGFTIAAEDFSTMETTIEMNAHQNTWETYTRSWSETDTSKRMQIFEQCLSPDCVYTDPLIQASGYIELSGYMSELHKNVPGVRFITTDFKNHHDRSLTHWNMVDGDGNILSQGASYGLYGTDGRLMQMTGFYEAPTAG
jgi:hypothetical protein